MAEVHEEVLANVWTRAVADSNSNRDSTALRRTVSKMKVSGLPILSTSLMPCYGTHNGTKVMGLITQKTIVVMQ